MKYDVRGDIRGQADKLNALLTRCVSTTRCQLWFSPRGQHVDFVEHLINLAPEQNHFFDIFLRMIDAATQSTEGPKMDITVKTPHETALDMIWCIGSLLCAPPVGQFSVGGNTHHHNVIPASTY